MALIKLVIMKAVCLAALQQTDNHGDAGTADGFRDFTTVRAAATTRLQTSMQFSGIVAGPTTLFSSRNGVVSFNGQRIFRWHRVSQQCVSTRSWASSSVSNPVTRYIPVWRCSVSRNGVTWGSRQFAKAAG